MRFDPQKTRQRLAKTLARVREALQSIDPRADDAALKATAFAIAGEAGEILSKADSENEIMNRLAEALYRELEREGNGESYPHIRDFYGEAIVYEIGRKLYKRPFAMEGDEITFGAPVEVILQYAEVADPEPQQAQAAESDPDAEAVLAIEAVGSGLVKIIREGQGSSGNWTREALRRDGAKAWPAGTHMYWNHPTASEARERPERSLDTLAGVLEENAKWLDNGPAGPGLYARAKVRSPFREAVQEMSDWIGVSVRAMVSKEGDDIVEIFPGAMNSVDFVTKPGAGGAIAQAFESVGRGPVEAIEGEIPMNEKQLRELIAEALKPFGETLGKLQSEIAAAKQASESLGQRMTATETREAARALVAEADLPEAARVRVVESIVAAPKLNADGSLDQIAFASAAQEAVKREADYIAALGGGKVQGMGGGARETAEEAEDFSAMIAYYRRQGLTDEQAHAAAGIPYKA